MLIVQSSGGESLQLLLNASLLQTETKTAASSASSAPSNPAASSSSTSTSRGSSSGTVAGVPQSVLTALENYTSPLQQAWDALTSSLSTGHIASAQAALTTYNAALSAAGGSLATPSAAFLGDLATLRENLQAGDLSAAQSTFATAQQNAPASAAEDVYWAESEAELDGWEGVYALQHARQDGGLNTATLFADIANVDSALREEATYISDALVSTGDTAVTANQYASEITGISIGQSAQENSAVDATRAAQWIQDLVAIAENGSTSSGYSNLKTSNPTVSETSVSDELASILFADTGSASDSIHAGQFLQQLIDRTLDNNGSASATDASPGASGSTLA